MSAKLSVEQSLMKAKSYVKKGDIVEAQKLYETILQNFSNNIRARQGLATLNKASQSNVIQHPPQEAFSQLVNLYNKGQITAAIEHAESLIAQYPGAYIVWNILGASRAQIGMLDEAIEAYQKCISLKPDFADAYYNKGVAFQAKGKFDLSIEAYNKAILIKPDYPEAFNNMGVALKDQGKLDEAIEAFNKIIKLRPDHNEAYNNISIILKDIIFKKPNPSLHNTLLSLLNQKSSVRPRNIAKSAISLLKLEPKLKTYLGSKNIGDECLKILKVIKDLSNFPLLLKLMSVCPITDIEVEYLLRRIRAGLLSENSYLSKKTEILKFQSALALQCFTNEYIYNQNEYEDKALESLEELVKLTIKNNEQPKPQLILCLASYKPLNHYEWYNQLHVSSEIEDVYTRQVIEPKQEKDLKIELPLLQKINNKTSSKVRTQYELNPYPRWVNLRLHLKPVCISKIISEMKLKIFDDKIKNVETPDILIAGCGTGQHSIETAVKFKSAKVLAVDLSLSSLAYAKRKTKELNIQNIDYMQADILDLGKLGKQFDIVESVGVLHHMADPVAGWKVLTNCLKLGGLMKIGLYSELARQDIVEMRKEISKAGFGSSDFEMKSFRNMLIKSDTNHYRQILNSNDFYSLSEFRDLLFHVQEHRFTIHQIKECLFNLGLKFCGFESSVIDTDYKLNNCSEDDLYNLDKWQTYEVKHPWIFSGMYQFWCQKI